MYMVSMVLVIIDESKKYRVTHWHINHGSALARISCMTP